MAGARSRRAAVAGGSVTLVALGLLVAVAGSCTMEFDPRTLVNDLRVLGIRAEPTDLTSGEATAVTALVSLPGLEDAIEYQWEWCPVTEGPDSGYACITEGFGVDPAVFDLGTGTSAVLPYFAEAEQLKALCEAIVDQIDALPDFVEVPQCDLGVEIYVRLTVSIEGTTGEGTTGEGTTGEGTTGEGTTGEGSSDGTGQSGDPSGDPSIDPDGVFERVAIKRVFLWFQEEPEPLMRNVNPIIERVLTHGFELDEDFVLRVAPGGDIPFFVEVDESAKQTYVRRDLDDTEQRTEEILFSWFSSEGEWDRELSFSDDEEFTLREAGRNTLFVPSDAEPGTPIDVFFVVRDGRGGQSWQRRRLLVSEPTGSGPELSGPIGEGNGE